MTSWSQMMIDLTRAGVTPSLRVKRGNGRDRKFMESDAVIGCLCIGIIPPLKVRGGEGHRC